MANKVKKVLFGTAIAGMTFGGGFGLSKHNAKVEKEQLKTKVETAFDKQIKDNQKQLSEINEERSKLHHEALHVISSMIEQQNDTASKQMKTFYSKAIKSFTPKEIEQLKEEWENCTNEETNWDEISLVKWAINIDGDTNTANNFSPHSEYDVIDAKIKYPKLGVKRRALRKEWDNIKFIRDDESEKAFISNTFVHTNDKNTAKLYSYIMQDFAEYYNRKHNKIEYWEEKYDPLPGGGSIDVSGYRTRTGHINDIEEGIIPNFSLIAFKQYKKELDKICARLQELDTQEKQLQQIPNLKKTIVADFSR